MKNKTLLFLLTVSLMSCDVFTFSFRSRKSKHREMPSLAIFENIIDFREKYGEWPSSREMLEYRSKKYYEDFRDFKYTYTKFKISDNDNMVFYYSGHVDDNYNEAQTGKIDLNDYAGYVKFFKVNDKFAWKLHEN